MEGKVPKNAKDKAKKILEGKPFADAVKGSFPCPPLLGRFWDFFILYHDRYKQFCDECFGAYILRNHDDDKAAYKLSKKLKDIVIDHPRV